jgi:hypothetical protein
MKKIILALAASSSLTAAATPPAQAGGEVSIPFARFGGIWNFEAQDDDVIYLQDRSRNWYRAQLSGPCFGLRFADGIGVDTRGSASFDRFSTLIVGQDRCQIESLTRSGPPPRRRHGKKAP